MKHLNKILAVLICMIVVYCSYTVASRFDAFDLRITNLEQRLEETQEAESRLLKELSDLNRKSDEIRKIEEERNNLLKQHAEAISIAKTGINVNTDLVESTVALNADDMNRIIDGWTEHINQDSLLKGHGEAFIVASRETGLNPVYLLAHAIVESGSGTSYLAVTKLNFFGINAIDTNPDRAYVMGDNVDDAIVNSAIWIKSNFYNNGYETLADMSDGGYATNPDWPKCIVNVANESIQYL